MSRFVYVFAALSFAALVSAPQGAHSRFERPALTVSTMLEANASTAPAKKKQMLKPSVRKSRTS
jgi:hypothetical protein